MTMLGHKQSDNDALCAFGIESVILGEWGYISCSLI